MLDVPSITFLSNYLQSYPSTLLVVSHDRAFLNEVATDIIHQHSERLDYYKGADFGKSISSKLYTYTYMQGTLILTNATKTPFMLQRRNVEKLRSENTRTKWLSEPISSCLSINSATTPPNHQKPSLELRNSKRCQYSNRQKVYTPYTLSSPKSKSSPRPLFK